MLWKYLWAKKQKTHYSKKKKHQDSLNTRPVPLKCNWFKLNYIWILHYDFLILVFDRSLESVHLFSFLISVNLTEEMKRVCFCVRTWECAGVFLFFLCTHTVCVTALCFFASQVTWGDQGFLWLHFPTARGREDETGGGG